MDAERLQILSNHYTHTFDFLQTFLKKRDRLFAALLLILVVLLFQIYTPKEASDLVSTLIVKKLDINTGINLVFIQSIFWFLLLSVLIKYFQSVIFIERQYSYLHSLEGNLCSEYKGQAFTREGKSYLKNYPAILNWASFLYTILFPTILLTVSTSKIICEYRQYGISEVLFWFNLLIYFFIITSLVLYLYEIHIKKEKEQPNNPLHTDHAPRGG